MNLEEAKSLLQSNPQMIEAVLCVINHYEPGGGYFHDEDGSWWEENSATDAKIQLIDLFTAIKNEKV